MKNKFLPIAVFLVLFGAFYRVFRLEFLPDLPNFAPSHGHRLLRRACSCPGDWRGRFRSVHC